MSETVTYEEIVEDGAVVEASVSLSAPSTRVDVTAEAVDDSGQLVLAYINQPQTTIVDSFGLPLVPRAIQALAKRVDLDAHGLLATSAQESPHAFEDPDATEDDKAENDTEVEPEDDPEEEAAGGEGDVIDESAETDYDSVEAYLEDVDEAQVAEIAEAAGVDSQEVHSQLQTIDDERIEKRRDPEDGRRKLYSLDATEEENDDQLWCSHCGYGPKKSMDSMLRHHGEEHPDAEPMLTEVEPYVDEEESGYWCGVCGTGPFDEALDVEEHHQDEHGSGNAVALEYEPEESELVEDVDEVRFTDWNGGQPQPAADGGQSR